MAGLQPILDEYMDMPVVTKIYTTSCVLITTAVQMELVTPFHLYFNPWLIAKGQVWRLYTCFCFFGTFGFSFLFNLIFTYRYCRMLEEGSFRRHTADFVMMFVFGAGLMLLSALAVHMVFLGQALTIMLVYVWSRRNPHIRMNFFGLITFRAPYLPYVLAAFSLLLGNQILVDFMGIAVGHFYYYLEDVFPRQQGGFKVLYTPMFLRTLLDPPAPSARRAADANYEPAPEAGDAINLAPDDEIGARRQQENQAPGGFDWNEDWEQVNAEDVDNNGGADQRRD